MDQNNLNPEVFLKKGPGCNIGLQIHKNSWEGQGNGQSGGMPLQQHVCVSFSWKMEQKKRNQEKFQAHLCSFSSKEIHRNFGSACQNNGVYRRLAQKTSPEACIAKNSQGIPNKIKRSWKTATLTVGTTSASSSRMSQISQNYFAPAGKFLVILENRQGPFL